MIFGRFFVDEKIKVTDVIGEEEMTFSYQAPQLLKLEDTEPENGGTNVPEPNAGIIS